MKCVCVKFSTFAEFCSKLPQFFRLANQRSDPMAGYFPEGATKSKYFPATDILFLSSDLCLAVGDLGERPRRAPLRPKISQFHTVFRKIWQNHMMAPLGGLAPLLRGILDPPLPWYLNQLHWWILGGPNSISCSFWENIAKSYVDAPGGLAPPPRGNPGSATELSINCFRNALKLSIKQYTVS